MSLGQLILLGICGSPEVHFNPHHLSCKIVLWEIILTNPNNCGIPNIIHNFHYIYMCVYVYIHMTI